MPKLTAKGVQQELLKNKVWPVYWIYGPEQLKIREITQRIKNTHLHNIGERNLSLSLESLDGEECDAESILEAAQTLSLSCTQKFIMIKNAHKIKNLESLEPLFSLPPGTPEEVQNICLFISKDFDARKKFSKTLQQKAAVIECEEVPEEDKEAWIQFLLKRKNQEPHPELTSYLRQLEPWSLDRIDQELEKIDLFLSSDSTFNSSSFENSGSHLKSQNFIDFFFNKDLQKSLLLVHQFASQSDEAIPLLGLLSWNLKNFIYHEYARLLGRSVTSSIHSFTLSKIQNWSTQWKLSELLLLESKILELDFSLKQTQKSPQAAWTLLCLQFMRREN